MPNIGFILTKHWFDSDKSGLCFEYWLKTQNGPKKLLFTQQSSVFFIPKPQHQQALNCLQQRLSLNHWYTKELTLKDFQQNPVVAYYFKNQKTFYQARSMLKDIGLSPLEADIAPQDRFLMERFITAGVQVSEHNELTSDGSITDESKPDLSQSDLSKPIAEALLNPSIKQASYQPCLSILSLDIETSMNGKDLYSIGMVFKPSIYDDLTVQKVYMINQQVQSPERDYLTYVTNETNLLKAFLETLRELDPDVIVGWNVVNFDLRFLQKKFDQYQIHFSIGREDSVPRWRTALDNPTHYLINLSGRVILDGIETLKSATYTFDSFSLNFVAQKLLGKNKLLQGASRGEDIQENFRNNKPLLADYNLVDCQLVIDIFQHCKLLDFSIERAFLTGLNIDRFGGSVAAFDNRYLPLLHRQGYVAPNIPETPENVGSPGGYVMDSQPGVYYHVLVLDFKSLYPSIIRTFKIDPLALVEGLSINPVEAIKDQLETDIGESDSLVPGFNGAVFSKSHAILPKLIEQLWDARDKAKKNNNLAMSQAIKILMNSFYGVLGTPGCRFFDFRLPSSITLRGHQILYKTKELIESKGYQVIYGDTDSVFVWLKGYHKNLATKTIEQMGKALVQELNKWWQQHLFDHYHINSFLELEFETHFTRFIMPTIRGSEKGSKKRYAGLSFNQGQPKLVFKGLESVRTDWTLAAREFQQELYRRVFFDEEYHSFIETTVQDIHAGKLDEKLTYRKRLRRHLHEYERNIPPQVQAAKKAVSEDPELAKVYRKGAWVEYLLTLNGPESTLTHRSPLDYQLYVERQIKPIADSLLQFYQKSFDELITPQKSLF